MTVQLLTPNTDREGQNAQRHRQTDRQTEDSIVPTADHTACSKTTQDGVDHGSFRKWRLYRPNSRLKVFGDSPLSCRADDTEGS